MLLCINETNLKQKEVRQCEKRQKRHESPEGGWGMGLKDPIQRNVLLSAVTISEKLYDSSWFLYIMKPRSYKVPKLKITVKTAGGFGWHESNFRTVASPLSVIPTKK